MKAYQVIRADTIEEMNERTERMSEQGYVPIGGIVCKTERRTIEHNIKGQVIAHCPYYIQSFWRRPPNADSQILFEQAIHVLAQVHENMAKIGEHNNDLDHMVVIDEDIAHAVDAVMRGEY